MQAHRRLAENAARLVVLAGGDHYGERARSSGALQQQGVAVPGQNLRRAFTMPPRHHGRAATFLFFTCNLEHGRRAVLAHGQKRARPCFERLAVGNEIPAGEMDAEAQSPPLPPTTMTVSFSGSS